jgi:hypothetical protein
MVRRRRSPIIGEEIEKSKKIGKEVKTGSVIDKWRNQRNKSIL